MGEIGYECVFWKVEISYDCVILDRSVATDSD